MRLFRVSLMKLVKRPASWVELAILLALIALVFVGLGASAGRTADLEGEVQVRLVLSFPNAYSTLVGIILSFGGLLAVTYGAAVIGADWAWGTIRAIVARGESRMRYTVVTFMAIAIMLGIGVLAAFAVGSVVAVFAADMAGYGSAGATEASTLATIPDLLGRTWLGVTEQAAIGFAIAMLFRSQLAGVAAGLAFYFGEVFLGLVPLAADVMPYLPFSVANAVVRTAEGFGSGGLGSTASLDSGTAIVLSFVYLLAALALAAVAAQRAQITR
jgi:ABC-2 type transport system permease protein